MTENQIIEQVDKLFANITRFIVSHSGKPIANADMLIEIKHGSLNVISQEQYNA